MNWLELEQLLARSRMTGRPIEFEDQDETQTKNWRDPYTHGWPAGTATIWREMRPGDGFDVGWKYRLGGITNVRPFTPAEMTAHYGAAIQRANCDKLFSIGAASALTVDIREFSSGKHVAYSYESLAADFHFLRDDKGDKTMPPCGVVVVTQPCNQIMLDIPSTYMVRQAKRQLEVTSRMIAKLTAAVGATPEEIEACGGLDGVIRERKQDWLDSVAECLRAVGIDPATPEGKEITKGYGTKPSDAIRGRLLEALRYGDEQWNALNALVTVIDGSGSTITERGAFTHAKRMQQCDATAIPDLRKPYPPRPSDACRTEVGTPPESQAGPQRENDGHDGSGC